MTTVTVDVADLQTLLFATGCIQTIEGALKNRDRDPLAVSAKGKLSEAHDRLATAWRRASREPPPEPDEADIATLRRMFAASDAAMIAVGTDGLGTVNRFAQVLQLIEAGPAWPGVKIDWPAPATPEFRQDGMDPRDLRYAARLTARGLAVLGR